jgi:hypothetical protein
MLGWRRGSGRYDRKLTVVLATVATGVAAALLVACGKGDSGNAASNSPNIPVTPPVAGKISANAPQADADSDQAARAGADDSGLPNGYRAVFDHANAKPTDVSYAPREPGRFEVTTGPAHILYAAHDTAAGTYSATATFEQLQAPAHPEAFGVFIGGTHLDSASVKYTCFLVRGDGKYMVKVRDGSTTRTITDWTANPAIPKQDADGKALYGIRIDVRNGSASVTVNGAPVTVINGKSAPLNGIAGVRINHNLRLLVTPVSLVR